MNQQMMCPQCRNNHVLRSRPQSPQEHIMSWVWIVPFHCQHCSHRFVAWSVGKEKVEYSADRREHLRIPVRLCLSFSGGKVRGEGIVMDLSLGGCIIKSDTRVHINDIFYLEIAAVDHEEPIEVAAMVRSVSARGIAFKFLRKAQENTRLLSFIRSVSGSTPSVFPQVAESIVAASLAHPQSSPASSGSSDSPYGTSALQSN